MLYRRRSEPHHSEQRVTQSNRHDDSEPALARRLVGIYKFHLQLDTVTASPAVGAPAPFEYVARVAAADAEPGRLGDITLGPITRLNAARRSREEHRLSCPWNHLRVSFKITTKKGHDEFLADFNEVRTRLPEGWQHDRIYYTAADMPVERVEFILTGIPRFADGAAVRAFLNMIE
jgi:hypothetical protein